MPMFEYICRECRHHFEAFVTGGRKANCPKCQSRKLDQQVSTFSFNNGTGYTYSAQSFGRVHAGSAHSRTITGRKRG